MTTDVNLTKGEQSFLDACRAVQALGLFPSNVAFAKHTKYRLPYKAKVTEMRERLVAKGVLVLEETPTAGKSACKLLTDREIAIIARLSLAEPRLEPTEIHKRFVTESGRESEYMTIFARISRIRDAADTPASGIRADDEKAVRAKIDDETKERVEKDGRRIERIERRRNVLAAIDRQVPARVSAAEACRAILEDWKIRHSTRKPKVDNRPTAFTSKAFSVKTQSRRMDLAKGIHVHHRHVPYGMEAGVG